MVSLEKNGIRLLPVSSAGAGSSATIAAWPDAPRRKTSTMRHPASPQGQAADGMGATGPPGSRRLPGRSVARAERTHERRFLSRFRRRVQGVDGALVGREGR